MATAKSEWTTDKYDIGDFSLYSNWTTVARDGVYACVAEQGDDTKDFPYSYPSGTVIKSAYICCTVQTLPETGISEFTVKGASGSTSKTRIPVTIKNTNGTVSVKFVFRAYGRREREESGRDTLSLTNVYLEITHRPIELNPAADASKSPSLTQKKFPAPPQSICVINQSVKEFYTFDGVIEVKHSFSSRFDECPSDYRDEYVNGARNEPDKISLDVMMSDVYTNQTDLTKGVPVDSRHSSARKNAKKHVTEGDSTSRSSNALEKLYMLKTKRLKLTIITPQHVYLDMVLGAVTVKQDEKTPFGWEAQLDFQHYLELKPEKTSSSSSASTRASSGRKRTNNDPTKVTDANVVGIVGANAIPSQNTTGARQQNYSKNTMFLK